MYKATGTFLKNKGTQKASHQSNNVACVVVFFNHNAGLMRWFKPFSTKREAEKQFKKQKGLYIAIIHFGEIKNEKGDPEIAQQWAQQTGRKPFEP